MSLSPSEFLPNTMNIELTTTCPLRCPQCYCSLTGNKNINLNTAIYWIKEGGAYGVKSVMLSGGETLCYPHIFDVVSAACRYCGSANVALSGFGFDQFVLNKLVSAGINGIYISLNGSTEFINQKTRDGFDLAISALKLLKDNHFPDTYINWVMHNSNSADFINVVKLAEVYNVKAIVIIALKPDANHNLETIPSKVQMMDVKSVIEHYHGSVRLMVESCYSPMRALMLDTKLFGNLNVGKGKGCIAGRKTFSVNVDGAISPCRHLEYFENYSSLDEYWRNSEVLSKIRQIEHEKKKPCNTCYLGDFCRHCLAINSKMKNDLVIGYEQCLVQNL